MSHFSWKEEVMTSVVIYCGFLWKHLGLVEGDDWLVGCFNGNMWPTPISLSPFTRKS